MTLQLTDYGALVVVPFLWHVWGELGAFTVFKVGIKLYSFDVERIGNNGVGEVKMRKG